MTYVHLRRYGKKPGAAEVATIDIVGDGQVIYRGHRYDLRTAEKGAKQPGFAHQLDGRFLQWNQTDGTLDVHHADGRIAPVHVVGGKPVGFVGDYLVYTDDSRQPWLVIDTKTSNIAGRVEDQRGTSRLCGSPYSSTMFPAQIQYRSFAGTSSIVSSTILRL